MKRDDIAERLLELSVHILRLVAQLPKSPEGKHISKQLLRAGTSGGANYEEARAAESRADFAHKVLVAAKELRESVYWLKLTQRAGLSPRGSHVPALIREGNELVAILKASAKTARARAKGLLGGLLFVLVLVLVPYF